jgi:hypothetical protein
MRSGSAQSGGIALVAGVLLGGAFGCRATNRASSGVTSTLVHEPAALAGDKTDERRRLEEREVTPELQQKAVDILRDNAGAPLGTEVSFEVGLTHYVGRIEQHWDAARGPHPGVTLYAVDTK